MVKVLIVEHDDAVRETRRFVLADAGYDVIEAVNDRIAARLLSAARQPVVALFNLLELDASARIELQQIAADERLARRHAYAVFTPDPRTLSSELRTILVMLGAYIIQWPASDDALLHTVALALERAGVNRAPVAHSRQEHQTRARQSPAAAHAHGAM